MDNVLVPMWVDSIPELLEQGVLYISEKFGVSIHLCACGCGEKTVLPFKTTRDDNHWSMVKTLPFFICLRIPFPALSQVSGHHLFY